MSKVNGKALKLSKWKMWYSDILPLQHEVKLADGERNSMVMLLLDYCGTVFLHFSPPISLHLSRPWTLVVGGAAELSLRIDCVVESETRVGGNVWVWISLHLKGHKKDFCLSWRSFSTRWSIPADCGNSFIFCVAVPFSKQVLSFSFGQIKSC